MKKLILLTMILLTCFMAEAIKVKVYANFSITDNPVPFAKIRVELPNGYYVTGAQTSECGQVIISGLTPKTKYIISARFLDGEPGTVEIETPEFSSGHTYDISVQIKVPGDEIIVTPSSIFSYTTAHNLKMPRLVAILEKKKNKAYYIV